MSDELKWCRNFMRAMSLRSYHRKRRVRKKNNKRALKLKDKVFKRWGYFPYPS